MADDEGSAGAGDVAGVRFAERAVYLVTAGEYSDYGVAAVFSTRGLAEAWIASAKRPDDYSVEVFPLDDPDANAPDGAWRVVVEPSGAVRTDPEWDSPKWHDGEDSAPRAIASRDWRGAHFVGWGKTVEHARRSAEELRRATIAGTVVDAETPRG